MDKFLALFLEMLRDELKKIVAETLVETKPESKEPTRPELLTRRQAKEKLHISYPTLNRLNKEGILKARKISGRVLYSWSDIEEALNLGGNLKYQRSKNSSFYR